MRALVIAPQPFFSPRGTPFSVYYRTLVLSEMGVQIDLLTYGEGQNVHIPGVRIIRIPRFKALGRVKTGPSQLKLFLDIFISLWTVGLLVRNRYDFVHAHEESVFLCRVLKPLFGFKLVYDMHSSLPQQLTNFGFTKSRLLISLFKRLEDTSIRAADAVITICPALADYVERMIGDSDKHVLIENSIFEDVRVAPGKGDAGDGVDADNSPAVTDLPAGTRFVTYTGTLESYQGIEILIGAFEQVMTRVPDAFLLIVGGTDEQVRRFSGLAKAHGIAGRCRFTGRVPQKLAKEYVRQADVIVSPRSTGTNTPLKVYEQLASGKPLVATRIFSHTQVLDETVAFLVEPEPGAMADGIVAALTRKEAAEKKVVTAMKLYAERYSRTAYEEKMARLLEMVG